MNRGPPPPPGEGTVRLTRGRVLAGLAVVGAAVGWTLVAVVEAAEGFPPGVPWSAVGALLFGGLVLLGAAGLTWRHLHRRRLRMDPTRAVNLLVLGKASALAGALFAGGYAGFGLRFVADLDAPLAPERAARCGLAVVSALVVVAGGLLLERACRVPRDEGDDGAGSGVHGAG